MAEFHRLRHRDEIEEDNNILYQTSSSSSSYISWDNLNEDAEILAKSENSNASMPRLDHLSLRDYDLVYEPADDTFLLLDAIQYEFQSGALDHLFKNVINNYNNKKTIVLEIGCGTGVASVFFRSQWLKRWETLQDEDNDDKIRSRSSRSSTYRAVDSLVSYATDINPKAIQVTLQTDSYNNGHVFHEDINPIQTVQCDLATDLLSQLQGKVDVLLFNPPYVPTDDSEVVDVTTISYPYDDHDDDNDNNHAATIEPSPSIITAAWAGGKDGRRVVDRAIPQIAQLLRRPPIPNPNVGSRSKDDDDDTTVGITTTTTSDDNGSTSGGDDDDGSGGVLYLVTVDDNRPAQLAAQLSASYSLEMKPLFRRRARNEFLTIQKIKWNKNHKQQQQPLSNDQCCSTVEQRTAITESSSSLL